jgi:hypothetical protein
METLMAGRRQSAPPAGIKTHQKRTSANSAEFVSSTLVPTAALMIHRMPDSATGAASRPVPLTVAMKQSAPTRPNIWPTKF